METKYYGSHWEPESVWLHYYKYVMCVQQKKETHTGLEQLEGEQMMTEFSFSSERFL